MLHEKSNFLHFPWFDEEKKTCPRACHPPTLSDVLAPSFLTNRTVRPSLLRLHELTSKDSHLKLLSFDAFIGCPAAPTSEASSSSSSCCDIITEEKGRFNTSLNSSLSLYGGGSYYFEYAGQPESLPPPNKTNWG